MALRGQRWPRGDNPSLAAGRGEQVLPLLSRSFQGPLKVIFMVFPGWAARIPAGKGTGLELVSSCLPPFLGMQEEQEKSAGALAPEGCSFSYPELPKGRKTLGKCLSHPSQLGLCHTWEQGMPPQGFPDLLVPSQICSFNFEALFAALNLPSGSNWGAGSGICPKHLPGVFLTCLSSASPEAQGGFCRCHVKCWNPGR